MKRLNVLISSLLVVLLMVFGCSSKSKNNTIPEAKEEVIPEHSMTSFADMKYERPNVDAINQKMDDIISMSKESNQEENLLTAYDELLSMFSDYDEMESLVMVHNNIDLTDSYYEEENQYLTNQNVELDNQMNDVVGTILDSEYEQAFIKKMGQDFIDRYEVNKKLNSPEIEELSEQETALVNKYSKLSTKTYTTMLDGKEVSLSDLDLSSESGAATYYEIYEKKNKELGSIYQELIKVRVSIAKKLGYDNYTDYAYDSYGRDYTKEDAEKFEENVLKTIAPLKTTLEKKYADQQTNLTKISFKDGIFYLETALKKEFPKAMQDALAYMKTYDLYSFNDSENGLHSGYTTIIGNAPFMYINTLDYLNANIVFHEFGHYYNYYLMGNIMWNDSLSIDIAEIHSQGLELLMFDYYDEIYGENAQIMKVNSIIGMLDSIVQGCAENEFERKIFENPEMSLDEMNQLHADIFEKYVGYPLQYQWVDIHHNFETPFYYISYATSAISALEIWDISIDSRKDALQVYRNMSQNTINIDYLDALTSSELSNPFTSDFVDDVASKIKKEFL